MLPVQIRRTLLDALRHGLQILSADKAESFHSREH